jgi:sodium-dependent phosphate transporter
VVPASIVISWFISPILSGAIGLVIFSLIKMFIVNAKDPLLAGLGALPIIYGLTIFVNVLGIVMDGSECRFGVIFVVF